PDRLASHITNVTGIDGQPAVARRVAFISAIAVIAAVASPAVSAVTVLVIGLAGDRNDDFLVRGDRLTARDRLLDDFPVVGAVGFLLGLPVLDTGFVYGFFGVLFIHPHD